jgi:hypothetical protein
MIRHIVLIRFRDDVSEEHRQEIYGDLRALVGKIDGLLNAAFGPNVSPEGLSKGFRDGFVMDLRDAESRDRYLAHPLHQAAGAKLVAACEGGLEGVLPFDLEL